MPLLDVKDCQLLVIDAQEQFYREHRSDVDREMLNRCFDVVAWTVGVANALSVPVVVTEEDSERNGLTASVIRTALPPTAAVLPKEAFAAPDNPQIMTAIEANGRSNVIVVGLETDICVTHSTIQLQARGYRPVVVLDAVYSPRHAHENGLARLERGGVDILSAKQLAYDWVRTVAGIRRLCADRPDLATPPGFSL